MQISSNIRNEMLFAFRNGASIKSIAATFGYTEKQIETVIYPNGKEAKQLPVVIHRKKPEPIPRERDVNPAVILQEVDHRKNLQEVDQHKKWSDAGKKAWITRQQNKLRDEQKFLPPAASDQPIALQVSHLITMHQEDKEKAMKLIAEALEYIQVGLKSIEQAIDILNK